MNEINRESEAMGRSYLKDIICFKTFLFWYNESYMALLRLKNLNNTLETKTVSS